VIKIYQYPSCPYCARVLQNLDLLGLVPGRDYLLIDASRGTPGRMEVLALGGKNQVPFLVDGDVKMYESQSIIEYLHNKFQKQIN